MKKKSSGFSGSLGFVLAAAGSAVGVGNIWRFPYLAAKDGGGLFLIVYLLLVFTFGFTLLTTGAHAQQLLDVVDYISNSFLMPLISLLTCILVGWIVKPKWIVDEMESSGHPFPRKALSTFMIRYATPVMMAVLFLESIGLLSCLRRLLLD